MDITRTRKLAGLTEAIDPILNTIKSTLPKSSVKSGIEQGKKVITISDIGEDGIGQISKLKSRLSSHGIKDFFYDGDSKSIKITY